MDLYLRRVIHPQTIDNYRVIMKDGGEHFEVGSIRRPTRDWRADVLGVGHPHHGANAGWRRGGLR